MIYGNVKAAIPFVRERLKLEVHNDRTRYRRGEMIPIKEDLAFGILTRY